VDVLMNPEDAKDLEDGLQRDAVTILKEEGVEIPKDFDANPGKALSEIIEGRGYHGIFGRTPPLLEFMVWETTDTKIHEVQLTDRAIEVPVHYLEDFVAMGWSNFATFGGPSTGGWATDEGLYVVGPKWDIESEAFRVSFLVHEARHYADYDLFPNLEGPDLEYRAKLTELIYAEEDLYALLEKFMGHAARVENAPHPLANWHVITDLSRQILGVDWPESPAVWKDVAPDKIHAAAAELLKAHGKRLDRGWGNTSKGVIKAE
ncbi:MAG TPA: hypothetical protein VD713_01775, partial [Sphingomonadales bacterium]|nr:hypothetical protein [Sphingomonadales bacterium]